MNRNHNHNRYPDSWRGGRGGPAPFPKSGPPPPEFPESYENVLGEVIKIIGQTTIYICCNVQRRGMEDLIFAKYCTLAGKNLQVAFRLWFWINFIAMSL
jgi:hypothetical protein